MEQETIRIFHNWSKILEAAWIFGLIILIILFRRFQYGKICMKAVKERKRKQVGEKAEKKGRGPKRKRYKSIMAVCLAVSIPVPVVSFAGQGAATYLQTEKNGGETVPTGKGRIAVEVDGDSIRPNVYRDTAVAEITFFEKNFDCESIMIKIGDETGRETKLTFEGGVWKGETGLGEGVLEVVPYIREDDNGESRKYWILDSEEGTQEHTENRTVKMRFRFPKEGNFTISEVTGRDLAGNISSLSEPVFVAVDRSPPEFQITLPEEELSHAGYYSHPITVWLFLKEHNFHPEEKDSLPEVTLETGDGNAVPVEETENLWKMAPEKGKDWYKFPLNVGEEANYRIQVSYEDPAGWPLTEKSEKEKVFTVDMTEPEFGTVTAMGESWNMLMEQITFGKYSSKEELVVLEGRDSISPVEPLQYFCSEREMTKAELEALPEKSWQTGNSLLLVPDTKAAVYLKVTNYAGLSNYFSSSGFIVENKGPVITLEPKGNSFPGRSEERRVGKECRLWRNQKKQELFPVSNGWNICWRRKKMAEESF